MDSVAGGVAGKPVSADPGATARLADVGRGDVLMDLAPGGSLGPYRLVEQAGHGGMAEVWRAFDARLQRDVAIKFLSPRYATDQLYLDRFRREAQAISRLDHPNVLAVYDYGEQDGWTYMVSPFLSGGTLAARLRRGPWSVGEAVTVLEPLAAALDYAHSRGIIHRDVKPSNVMFTNEGRLVLSDFGIARIVEGTTLLTQAGLIVGTPMYMSPEQADAQPVTGATDLYSLGVIAYELLTGRPPFLAETPLALLRAHIDKPLPPPRTLNPNLPEAVERVVFTILAKRPADRFASGRAFVEALRAADTRTAVTAPVPGPAPQPEPPTPTPSPTPEPRLRQQPTPVPAPPPGPAPRQTPGPAPDPTRVLLQDAPAVPTLLPLAMMAAGWALAWCLILGLRYTEFEALNSLGLPYFPTRFLGGGLTGLIGGGGIAAGLLLARRLSGRSAFVLALGWALSYALIHTALYVVVGRSAGTTPNVDHELVWLMAPAGILREPRGITWIHALLIDILPAMSGGCLTALAISRGWPTVLVWRLVRNWGFSAWLGMVVAFWMLTVASSLREHFAMVPFPMFFVLGGLIPGGLCGGLGGWLTLHRLWGVTRR